MLEPQYGIVSALSSVSVSACLTVILSLKSGTKTYATNTIMDSGASGCLIDQDLVELLQIPTQEKSFLLRFVMYSLLWILY